MTTATATATSMESESKNGSHAFGRDEVSDAFYEYCHCLFKLRQHTLHTISGSFEPQTTDNSFEVRSCGDE